ncbi:cytochrome P450 [Nocardiopsis sp. N85]|uniref:cytochrome P450 n=1 Tax=Nocardiopsis sp. N85 TaxID=3029400 RepID=UPI00237EF45A|nr:cytochrome P450 [Nocardiopsis sp. N85]MDE3720452.1 cytochrome P450 [Nocardiopsis sp. N85]
MATNRAPAPMEMMRLLPLLSTLVARGVIIRRPRWEAAAAALETDHRLSALLRELRERHGDGPLPLNIAGRRMAIVLAPEDVRRLLEGTPDPFSPAGREKRGALAHFQPHGVLASDSDAREPRREANEQALATGRVHPDIDTLSAHVEEEAEVLLHALGDVNALDWPRFSASFDALARRVIFGSWAATDHLTTALLRHLRSRADWSYAMPIDRKAREEFLHRVREGIDHAEPGSLAARLPDDDRVRPEDQVAHWLFAFDATAIASFRALALLNAESTDFEGIVADPARLAATVQESVRLWPTTLAILREGVRPTEWRGMTFEEGTAFVVVSSYFHRDPRLPYADAFTPEIWLDGRAEAEPGLVPFSHGPAECPGRDVVLATTSLFLRALTRRGKPTRLDAAPLVSAYVPALLDHTALRFSPQGAP